jgi:O-antigen ligase
MSEGRTADRIGAGRVRVDGPRALLATAALLVAAATIFGGASRENVLRLAGAELSALPLGMVAFRRLVSNPGETSGRGLPLTILALIIAVPLLQQIPLPPNVWPSLAGEAPRVEALRLAHLPAPWLSATLAPDETGRAGLALLPPSAMFLGAMLLDRSDLRRVAWLWIGLATTGLALGIAQVVAGSASPAYPYQTTNYGSLVGLFANRNHEADFLLALMPIAVAVAVPVDLSGQRATARRRRFVGPGLAWLFVPVSIVALGVIRSRAGVILAAPAALASLAIAWRGRRSQRGGWPMAGIAAMIGLPVLAVAVFSLEPIVGRFDSHRPAEFRFEAWPHVAAAAEAHLPQGSGLGSFDRVFEAVEPLALVGPTYFNHAHNDYLELWLETGWLGAAILVLFLVWFAPAAWQAWRSGPPLAQAASAAVILLMAQSVVDYPLRTETLAVLFGFCCGMLARRPSA